jgi:type VI secretion system secreted protein Hcp
MFQRKATFVLVFLAAASALAWTGSSGLAKPAPSGQAVVSAQSTTRHVAIVKDSTGEVSFPVLALSHSIVSPRDAASGLPTGKRQHKPFTIPKPVDKASPLLVEGLLKGEPLSVEVTSSIRIGGRWVPFRTVLLDTAFVGAIGPQSADDRPTEEVAFYYNRIAFNYVASGTTVEDKWSGEFP